MTACFRFVGDGRESVIAKKLQKPLIFCFHGGWIAPTGRFRNGRIAATGQIPQMRGFSLAASRSGLGLPIRRSGSLCLAALGGAGQVERRREQRGLAASRVERQRRQQRLGLSIGWSSPWALQHWVRRRQRRQRASRWPYAAGSEDYQALGRGSHKAKNKSVQT